MKIPTKLIICWTFALFKTKRIGLSLPDWIETFSNPHLADISAGLLDDLIFVKSVRYAWNNKSHENRFEVLMLISISKVYGFSIGTVLSVTVANSSSLHLVDIIFWY